jgi:hypothetical protein
VTNAVISFFLPNRFIAIHYRGRSRHIVRIIMIDKSVDADISILCVASLRRVCRYPDGEAPPAFFPRFAGIARIRCCAAIYAATGRKALFFRGT